MIIISYLYLLLIVFVFAGTNEVNYRQVISIGPVRSLAILKNTLHQFNLATLVRPSPESADQSERIIWLADDTIVIQHGGIDPQDSVLSIELLIKLKEAAQQKGGDVIFLLGNEELSSILTLRNFDYQYVRRYFQEAKFYHVIDQNAYFGHQLKFNQDSELELMKNAILSLDKKYIVRHFNNIYAFKNKMPFDCQEIQAFSSNQMIKRVISSFLVPSLTADIQCQEQLINVHSGLNIIRNPYVQLSFILNINGPNYLTRFDDGALIFQNQQILPLQQKINLDGLKHKYSPYVPRKQIGPNTRIVAIGDLHGDYGKAINYFSQIGLIEIDYYGTRFIAEDTIFVLMEDIFDRGRHSGLILNDIMRWKQEAPNFDSEVILLLGNHELMNIKNQFKFVNSNEMNFYLQKEVNWRSLFHSRSQTGRFLRQCPVAIDLDGYIFSHAGILPSYAEMGINKINRQAQNELVLIDYKIQLTDDTEIKQKVFSYDGPLWTRYYFEEHQDTCIVLEDSLRKLNGKAMIVGHTIHDDGIYTACGNKLIDLDVAFSNYMGDPQMTAHLEIRKGVIYKIQNGVKEELIIETDSPKSDDTQLEFDDES